MKITNLCWLLGCWGPVIGEVGVVGLVHHFAAHATTTTSNSLPQPLKHKTSLFSGSPLFTLLIDLLDLKIVALCHPFQLCRLFHPSCALQLSKRSPGHFSEFVKRVWCSFSSCSWWLVASSAGSGWPAGHSKGIVSLPPSRRSVTVAGGAGVQQQPAGTTIGGWHCWRWFQTRRRQSVDQREGRRGATRTRVGGRHQPRSPGGGSWCIGEVGAGGECLDGGGGGAPSSHQKHPFLTYSKSQGHTRAGSKMLTSSHFEFLQILNLK